MYTKEQLIKYPYFEHILQEKKITDIVDTLTGLISRPYITGFVENLIREGTPFSYGMVDLDNFKFINDTYGHLVGDGMLSAVAQNIWTSLGDFGVAGRFGGDEMIIVNLRDLTYADNKKFCVGIFQDKQVFRKTVHIQDCEIFITATMGMASYPKDAKNYDDLFHLIDKLLYRGKTKGRNCYVIYMEEKHKNIEIKKLRSHSQFSLMSIMAQQFDSGSELPQKMRLVYESLKDDMRLTNLFYINEASELKSIADGHVYGIAPDIHYLVSEEMFTTNSLSDIASISPQSYQLLDSMEIETMLLMRIRFEGETFGYLMCAEPHNLRIWQEEEFTLLFTFARMIASELAAKNQNLQ